MHHTEFDDFKKEVTKGGLDLTDFELNNTDLTNWQPHQLTQLQGSISITRKSTQKQKSYQTGHGNRWVANFSFDDDT